MKSPMLTLFSPFSSKNIQECRCGTASCRGVLGPKPKKPSPEERSLASLLLAGTKRKISAVFSSRGGKENPNSPKKRKLSAMASAAWTKAQNARAQDIAAREKAEKDAAELHAQKASREDRALKRSTSMQLSSRRTKVLRKGTRVSMPNLKSTKLTTVTMKRKSLPAPNVKKSTSKTSRLPSVVKRNIQASKVRKMQRTSLKSRGTPTRSPSPETASEVGEDSSPNITPAALRSATKKLKQTKLPFKPLSLTAPSSSHVSGVFSVPDTDEDEGEHVDDDDEEESSEESDSDDEDFVAAFRAAAKAEAKRHGKAPVTKSIHKTGTGVKKPYKRGFRGRFT